FLADDLIGNLWFEGFNGIKLDKFNKKESVTMSKATVSALRVRRVPCLRLFRVTSMCLRNCLANSLSPIAMSNT
ncbi:MAG: hypothetical protein ACE5NG_04465, partial [bacterium]